eukprot:4759369-Pyramimonas_sp.AAC.1
MAEKTVAMMGMTSAHAYPDRRRRRGGGPPDGDPPSGGGGGGGPVRFVEAVPAATQQWGDAGKTEKI